MEFVHQPVLLEECLDGLRLHPGGVYVDGTLGGAGHSIEIVKRILPGGRLIGIDQDLEAIGASQKRLEPFSTHVTIVHDNFVNLKQVLLELETTGVDGILLDIGVSSHQLDEGERGFTYMKEDAPLDMRMDRTSALTAKEIVNTYSFEQLKGILKDYGEERWADRIAKFILAEREAKEITTTGEVVEIIKRAIPAAARREGGHPAKRTFQALRVAVNDELGVLKRVIDDAVEMLNPGGRLCIITFQSLEDRIVKEAFRRMEHPCTCPPKLPVCICGKKPLGRAVTRKPITASEAELRKNSRSKSAKLRVFEVNS